MVTQNDNSARGVEDRLILCAKCGLPMSQNPHPRAGKPPDYLEIGTMYECIPCLVGNRHRWAERAMKAESAIEESLLLLERADNAMTSLSEEYSESKLRKDIKKYLHGTGSPDAPPPSEAIKP